MVGTSRSQAWRVVSATVLTFGGRLLGLGWIVLLTTAHGVAGLGQYSVAFAIAAIAVAGLDSAFLTRSIRTTDQVFYRDQSLRAILAVLFLVTALVQVASAHVMSTLSFAMLVIAGEIATNQVKAPSRRTGRVDRESTIDLGRQLLSIAAAAPAVAFSHPFHVVLGMYAVGYAPTFTWAVASSLRHLEVGRIPVGEVVTLNMGALAGAAYLQGDVLLLAAFTSDDYVGAYALAALIAANLSIVGQLYANSSISRVRSGEFPRMVYGLAAIGSLSSLIVALALMQADQANAAYMLLLFAPAVFARNVCWWLTLQLAAFSDDGYRLRSTLLVLLLRLTVLGILVALLGESVWIPLAAAVAESALLSLYLRRRREILLSA